MLSFLSCENGKSVGPSSPVSSVFGEEQYKKKRKKITQVEMPGAPCLEASGINQTGWSVVVGPHIQLGCNAFRNLLLLYYQTKANLKIATTIKQIGFGDRDGESAAHFCILPNLEDDYFEQFFKRLGEGNLLSIEEGLVEDLSLQKEGDPLQVQEKVRSLAQQRLSLCHCHEWLYTFMSSTTIAPNILNEVDGIFERGGLREIALEVLNEVSQGEKTPDEGFALYFKALLDMNRLSLEQTQKSLHMLDELTSLLEKPFPSPPLKSQNGMEDYIKKRVEIERRIKGVKSMKWILKKRLCSQVFYRVPACYRRFRSLTNFYKCGRFKELHLNLLRLIRLSGMDMQGREPSVGSLSLSKRAQYEEEEEEIELNMDSFFFSSEFDEDMHLAPFESSLEFTHVQDQSLNEKTAEEDFFSADEQLQYQTRCEEILQDHSILYLAIETSIKEEKFLKTEHLDTYGLQDVKNYKKCLEESLHLLVERQLFLEGFEHCPLAALGKQEKNHREFDQRVLFEESLRILYQI